MTAKDLTFLIVLFPPLLIVLGMVMRSTCLFRHRQKKYVACELVGTYIAGLTIRCPCPYANHKYKARWVCESCSKMGEHCVRGWGDWTVEHGNLVPNVKKLANWGSQ